MTYSYYFLVFVVSYFAFIQVNGQDFCTPATVQNLILRDESVLSWNPSPSDPCTISYYLVYIQSDTVPEEHVLITDQTSLLIGHLAVCENVRIAVTPVSTDDIQGGRNTIYTKIPAPPEANLDLAYLRLATVDTGVRLEWDIDDQWKNCLKEYRFVSYNENDDDILTMYMHFSYTYLDNLIPCTSYVFTVTALYNVQTEGHVSVIRYTTPSKKIDPPKLQRISPAATTVDLTWGFSGPKINRCPVNALVVDASPYFNISYPITGQNQINRPAMSIRLSNLQPDSLYLLRASANNTAGPSDPFVVAVQTLESN